MSNEEFIEKTGFSQNSIDVWINRFDKEFVETILFTFLVDELEYNMYNNTTYSEETIKDKKQNIKPISIEIKYPTILYSQYIINKREQKINEILK